MTRRLRLQKGRDPVDTLGERAPVFIPVGHDVGGLHRWPIVTFAIIALCALVFIANRVGPAPDQEGALDRFQAAAEYYLEHPELEAHPLLRRWMDGAIALEEPEVQRAMRAQLAAGDEATPLQEIRQAKLDELTAAWIATMRDGPAGRWGLVPSEATVERAFTSMFVHGDLFHLLFNMLFLYLSGPLIEDVWGRPFFLLFYLAAGSVAAWLFVLQYPDLAIPLIGASGAVAGVLGAMLVRHPQTRIRILWFWGFVVRRFSMPAWVVLPIWVGGELVWAWVMDAIAPESGGGGVAHWAHVFGFCFGVGIAGLVSVLGLERALSPQARDEGDHAVLRAVERALARDRRDEAWTLLRTHVARVPADQDAALAYWDLAKTLGRAREAAPVLLRVVRTELLADDGADAIAHWSDLRKEVPDCVPEIELAARIAQALGAIGHIPEAADLVRAAIERIDVVTPASALVELVRAARYAEDAVAAVATARALAHPGLPLAVRRALTNDGSGGAPSMSSPAAVGG